MKTQIRNPPTIFDFLEIPLALNVIYDYRVYLILAQLANSLLYTPRKYSSVLYLLEIKYHYVITTLLALFNCNSYSSTVLVSLHRYSISPSALHGLSSVSSSYPFYPVY